MHNFMHTFAVRHNDKIAFGFACFICHVVSPGHWPIACVHCCLSGQAILSFHSVFVFREIKCSLSEDPQSSFGVASVPDSSSADAAEVVMEADDTFDLDRLEAWKRRGG